MNTTGIWGHEPGQALDEHYTPPKTRLTGAGGANDIASGAKRVVIMVGHEKKRFVERVDYITSPGFLDGGKARERYAFVGGGPSAIVTTLGILRPHPETKEFELAGWFPFTGIDEIRASTGWALQVAPGANELPAPTAAELLALRGVDATGMLQRQA